MRGRQPKDLDMIWHHHNPETPNALALLGFLVPRKCSPQSPMTLRWMQGSHGTFSLAVRACTSSSSRTHPHSTVLCFFPIHLNLNKTEPPMSQRAAQPRGLREPVTGVGGGVGWWPAEAQWEFPGSDDSHWMGGFWC